jgi:hypothetical protein
MTDENADPNAQTVRMKRKYTSVVDSAKSCIDKIRKVEDLSAVKEYVDSVLEDRLAEQVLTKRVAAVMAKPEMMNIFKTLECKCTVCLKELWSVASSGKWLGVVSHTCSGATQIMIHAACLEELNSNKAVCSKCHNADNT